MQKKRGVNTSNNSKNFIEPGFDIESCFTEKFKKGEGYVKGDDSYFDSYSHFAIHEEMLKDKVRTQAYQKAIQNCAHLFVDKIVLDVGCGTGILSIFAANSGAKHVYGIEFANIANYVNNFLTKKKAQKIVKVNRLEDKITIIKGKMEDIELPVKEVDIIISEWMGYFLLYESMIDTIILARDKYLKPDGLIFPDKAAIYISTIEDEEYKNQKIHFWDDVYGINMKPIKKWALMEPIVDCVDYKTINSNICQILDLDLKTVKLEDVNFCSSYKLSMTRQDYVHALVAWFDVYFSHSFNKVEISTSPYVKNTHWKQVVFYLDSVLPVCQNDVLYGSIAVKKSEENQRELDIKISYHLKNNIKDYNECQYYRLT